MKYYEITYAVEDEAAERLSELAKRYYEINGWEEKEMLQFAAAATAGEDIKAKLNFLERNIERLEKEVLPREDRQVYISDEEREKCRKVINAFREELERIGTGLAEAGGYGFVKLQCYDTLCDHFEDHVIFDNSVALFEDLWKEWIRGKLFDITRGTPAAEMRYEDMFKCLTRERQSELLAKRAYFAEKSGIFEK